MIMRLFILLLFFPLISSTQSLKIGTYQSIDNVSFDENSLSLNVFKNDTLLSIDLNSFKNYATQIKFPKGFDIKSYKTLILKQGLFFVSVGGGIVYQLKENEIVRIDNSFNHKMQINSSVFTHNDTIFKYGGYGFWSVRNFFTYFDTLTNEWELYGHPDKSRKIPKGTFNNSFLKTKDNIYFFDGQQMIENDRFKNITSNELWEYNFITQQWNFKGTNKKLMKHYFIKGKDYFLNITNSEIEKYDILNNSIKKYRKSILANTIFIGLPSYIFDSKVYYFSFNDGDVFLNVTNLKAIFGEKISETKFYKNSVHWVWFFIKFIVIPLLLVLLLYFGNKFIKSRNKVKFLRNGVKYKNNFAELDKESLIILQKIIENKEVSSNEILKIVEHPQYSPAHNERLKVQKIEQLNAKLGILLNISKPVIVTKKSDIDRRIRLYVISKSVISLF